MPHAGRANRLGHATGRKVLAGEAGGVLRPILPLTALFVTGSQKSHHGMSGKTDPEMKTVEVVVFGPCGQRLQGAEVTFSNGHAIGTDVAVSDRHGRAVLEVSAGPGQKHTQLLVEAKGYWGRRIERPILHANTGPSAQTNAVLLEPIEGPAVDSVSWGLEAMRLDSVPCISHLGGGRAKSALIVGQVGQSGVGQPKVIAAASSDHCIQEGVPKPSKIADGVSSMANLLRQAAPEAEVTVLPMPLRPTISDAIAAIDWCIASGIDVACFCFADDSCDHALLAAVKRARRAGVVLICPVGEAQGRPSFPSTCDEAIGVAAIGHRTASPKGSAHFAMTGSEGRDGFCQPHLGTRGIGIDMVAPGIAVVADDRILSGSALAAVHVAAFALCLLHSQDGLRRSPRSGVRLLELLANLRGACMDLGFPADQQGTGLPVWGMKGRASLSKPAETRLAAEAQVAMNSIARALK